MTQRSGQPPNASSARRWAIVQYRTLWSGTASAWIKFECASTATKISTSSSPRPLLRLRVLPEKSDMP